MDTELLELCKEVYERKPFWFDVDKHYVVAKNATSIWNNNGEWSFNDPGVIPLYTSDYLLEKLPDALNSPSFNIAYRLQLKKISDWYTCEYSNHGWFQSMKSVLTRKGYDTNDDSLAYGLRPVSADASLKALLKLVIALDDAGELKS